MKNTLVIATLASCVTALCRAAGPTPVPENLLTCRKLPDANERVRCYDAQIDKMSASAVARSAPAQPAPTASAAAQVPAPGAVPLSSTAPRSAPGAATASNQPSTGQFGEETLPPAVRPKPEAREPTALLSNITAMRVVGSQKYAVSLSNGQIWRQEESSPIAQFFRVGDDVRIEKAALGSYHMSTGRTGFKNWVRVTRVQ
jgi:hypothetical protein